MKTPKEIATALAMMLPNVEPSPIHDLAAIILITTAHGVGFAVARTDLATHDSPASIAAELRRCADVIERIAPDASKTLDVMPEAGGTH